MTQPSPALGGTGVWKVAAAGGRHKMTNAALLRSKLCPACSARHARCSLHRGGRAADACMAACFVGSVGWARPLRAPPLRAPRAEQAPAVETLEGLSSRPARPAPTTAVLHGGGPKRSKAQARPAARQAHPFFEGVDWAALPQRAPPYAPRVEHALDTQNFERFDEEAGPAGGSGGKRWARADPNFIGYTYKNWEAVASPSGARSPPSPRRPYVRRGRRCMPGPLGAGGALGALATLHALC